MDEEIGKPKRLGIVFPVWSLYAYAVIYPKALLKLLRPYPMRFKSLCSILFGIPRKAAYFWQVPASSSRQTARMQARWLCLFAPLSPLHYVVRVNGLGFSIETV